MSETITCTHPEHSMTPAQRRVETITSVLVVLIGAAVSLSVALFTELSDNMRPLLTIAAMIGTYAAVRAVTRGMVAKDR